MTYTNATRACTHAGCSKTATKHVFIQDDIDDIDDMDFVVCDAHAEPYEDDPAASIFPIRA